MARHLIVVEGAHDAAFFGRILDRRGFSLATNLNEVPDFWKPAIPRNYPTKADLSLDRVVSFPEIYCRKADGSTVGLVVALGDSGLLREFRNYLDLFDAPNFDSLGVVLDTDWAQTEAERFASFRNDAATWNERGVADRRPGFPLQFPEGSCLVTAGAPRLGVYQFPGGGAQGALETVLLACAEHIHPLLAQGAGELVEIAIEGYPADANPDPLKAARKTSGSAKARCGIVANLLKPGSSLAVAIRYVDWLPEDEAMLPEVRRAGAFLDALLAD